MQDKANQNKHLRFNPIQIAEWLQDLSNWAEFSTTVALAKAVGISRARATQYLNLLRIPEKYRAPLKDLVALTEYQLRPIVAMTPKLQRRAVRSILARAN